MGDTRARHHFKDYAAVRFQARVLAAPEGRAARESQQMGHKVARLVHDLHHQIFQLGVAVMPEANMHMHAKNEELAGHRAHVVE